MKKRNILIQNIITYSQIFVLFYSIIYIIYLYFFDSPRDTKRILQVFGFAIGFCFYLIKTKRKPVLHTKKEYEKEYKFLLENTFTESTKCYNKLIKCFDLLNYRKYKETRKLLDSLRVMCVYPRDYIAVYTLYALCYDEEENYAEAISYYNKVLQYDMSISFIWSNLGLCYIHTNNIEEASTALSNAIMYDAYNTNAYINMAHFFYYGNVPQAALHFIKKALELEPNNRSALFWATHISKECGDEENTIKYQKLYLKNGGSKSNLQLT